MKLLLTAVLLQVIDLASAQSDCHNDEDTFNDERGNTCSDYKGLDCVAVATKRGVTPEKISELLIVCPYACGICGPDSIVKECEDDSCQCKDTADYKLVINSRTTLTCSEKTADLCAFKVHNLGLSDDQVREYFSNCAASCQVCRPCSNIRGIGDGFCDPGNNNDKCWRYERKGQTQVASARFDGGDCCNSDDAVLNSLRYAGCSKSSLTSFVKNRCKCLTAPAAGEKDRRKDCVGGFGDYGPCSVTCETGVQKRTFKEISPAQAGGQACTHKDGDEDERICGRPTDKCPSTTTTTTTTPETTTTTATTSTAASPTSPTQTTLISGNDDKEASGAATAAATAMMMAIACLTLLKI